MGIRIAVALALTLALLAPARADMRAEVAALAPDALVLVVDADGEVLVERNADEPFVPASVAKIVTAWLAMEALGGEHRFETVFHLDADRVLYVRGGGDPFLVSEELALLAPRLLSATGPEPFARMVLDAARHPVDLRIPGIEDSSEAFDAANGALAVNFNTIHAVRRGATVRSAEEQTPITPLAIDEFRARGPNGRGRIGLGESETGVRYAGEVLAAMIERGGGVVEGDIAIGTVPPGLGPVYVHRQSRDLSEIVRLMLLGSNNFIANQVFLEVGAHLSGEPASLPKSRAALDALLARHGLDGEIALVEGSGISRESRFTARGMVGVLDRFAPHAALLRRSEGGSRYKTGTLSGVSTLAGYVGGADGPRFVISVRGGGRLRFRILQAIERGL